MSRSWRRRFCWITEGKLVQLWAELVAAVRRRGRGDGSDDEEDLGLPQSPPASPPTDKVDKRHLAGISQSSCSDGSLLSVGSSEMDEDSSSGHHHSHEHSRSDHFDFYNTSEPPTGVAPLSHSAARHKMAVRPRRTHGPPRRNKNNAIAASALPITPELNEEMIRSVTPEVAIKTSEIITESFSSSSTKHHKIVKEQHHQVNRELQRVLETPTDTKLKSSSLPPGLALSQLGQSPAKLSIAESNTPRSSIKRSQSSSQGTNLRENSPKKEIHSYRSEDRMLQYRSDNKYAEESCHEKKSKSEKKTENENIKSSKKEESFFSRLLLRKSGKKSKKDQIDGESQLEVKKSKTEREPAKYKSVDSERLPEAAGHKPVPPERSQKSISAGQRVFANQMHKRLDTKGSYVQDSAYKDVYSAAKVPGLDYNITDLKIAEETDRMLNMEIKNRFSRREELIERPERCKRIPSKETFDDKKDSFNLQHDTSKRPVSVQKLVEPVTSKAFISNETASRVEEEMMSPTLVISDEEPPIRATRIKNTPSDYMFSSSMPKNLPYFNTNVMSSSPPKSRQQSSEAIKQRSSEHVSEVVENIIKCKRESVRHAARTEESYVSSGIRSLGDEYVETRSSIGKSHSFRYASECSSISSQENQLPSLPAVVGISEPFLESWEVNYRRNVTERNDVAKRGSTRNYGLLQDTADANYDSLPSTDSSYLDSLKTDANEDKQLFTNSIHITMDHKRDSDISQIEAKIDDIISSPKPILSPILKSSSLDSIKSSSERPVEDRRKTISVESALSQGSKPQKEVKLEPETFISVTHINKEQSPVKNADITKAIKTDERTSKEIKPGVPEFFNIQLNKVDVVKQSTNVVLTANVTPKKPDSPQMEKDQDCFPAVEPKSNIPLRKDSFVAKAVESIIENSHIDVKLSPALSRKSIEKHSPAPQSPSTPKAFFKRKAGSVELQDKPEKPRTNSLSTEGSTEKIYDNISVDQKSHSSYGSKSSIQSTDSLESKVDRPDDGVVYRKKPVPSKDIRGDRKDDEPELMKVFARRSLKIKDTEADSIAQDIAKCKEENDNATKTKTLKNEFNASIKSRDSDKENEEAVKDDKRAGGIAARVSQFGAHYQRSVSIASVAKRDSAPVCRNELNRYKKEVSDSTPEKRLRNRTFPDSANDREDIKSITKSDVIAYKADTLTKRPWQRNEDKYRLSAERERRESAVIEKDGDVARDESAKGRDGAESEADASPQFKGILQMRAEWERRAKQGMTK
ncbi:uncharacterized protein LOC114241703 isoform X2 [Bombyx mandarina]|uniref:Uncharacterized protein LOC114241703 isoform X2 n=1 Tax=Bombyx mandarina TaxID=7092 RepID=A0A6J2JG01_BOMMA|nr:uncharacterized protein LOC114241703 isoform X2 [Bombyx mandarina]